MLTEVGTACFIEEIDNVWMIRPVEGPRYLPPKGKYKPPPAGKGRAVGDATNPGLPHRAGRATAGVDKTQPQVADTRGQPSTPQESRPPPQQPASSSSQAAPPKQPPQVKQPPPRPAQQQPPQQQPQAGTDFLDSRPPRGRIQQRSSRKHNHTFTKSQGDTLIGGTQREADWQRPWRMTTTTTSTITAPLSLCSAAATNGQSQEDGTTTDEENTGSFAGEGAHPFYNNHSSRRRQQATTTAHQEGGNVAQGSSSTDIPAAAQSGIIAAQRGAMVAATAQLQLVQEIAREFQTTDGDVIQVLREGGATGSHNPPPLYRGRMWSQAP